ncbi:hypothetical protein C4585_02370 [Candidatus Parcubacteria bacterium]|nr:MAG: hypothetical protein C4585_02370 [Candidatus Parcubacteria bacterium]
MNPGMRPCVGHLRLLRPPDTASSSHFSPQCGQRFGFSVAISISLIETSYKLVKELISERAYKLFQKLAAVRLIAACDVSPVDTHRELQTESPSGEGLFWFLL